MAEDKETSVVTELWAGATIGDTSVAGLLGPYHQRKVFPYQISELGRMARGKREFSVPVKGSHSLSSWKELHGWRVTLS